MTNKRERHRDKSHNATSRIVAHVPDFVKKMAQALAERRQRSLSNLVHTALVEQCERDEKKRNLVDEREKSTNRINKGIEDC